MDPVTVGAVLLAVATGVSEVLGGQLWAGVVSLVRRPRRGAQGRAGELPASVSGEAELAALQQSPGDRDRAVVLAGVLLARAAEDGEFERALRQWWEQAAPMRAKAGSAQNTISGGMFSGPVIQGRDFTNLNFGAGTVTPPVPPL